MRHSGDEMVVRQGVWASRGFEAGWGRYIYTYLTLPYLLSPYLLSPCLSYLSSK